MSTIPVTILHADHGLQREHIQLVEAVARDENGFFLKVVDLPAWVADLTSALYGPSAGDGPIGEDEVRYEGRGDRPGPSRMVDRPHRPCRKMVVVGVATPSEIKVFTAYGTQASTPTPREWWDASMKPHEAVEAAKFWTTHALAL